MFFLLFGFLVSFDALLHTMCFSVCNDTGRVAVVIKMLVQGWVKIVSFAQFKMLGLSLDFIMNSVDSSLENAYAVFIGRFFEYCCAVSLVSTFGLCSIYHDIVQQ